MSRNGNLWQERQRVAWLSVGVSIVPPGGGATRNNIPATVSATNRSTMDANGAFIVSQFRAFLVSREALPEEPTRGMRITLVEDGRTMVYAATPPSDGEPVWQWSDRTQVLRKIHCLPVAA
jgi:hypothetical protein